MKKFVAVILSVIFVVSLTACSPREISQNTSKTPVQTQSLTAKEITDKLKDAKLPIDDVIVYNEDNDVNKLLGRPNQYVSKVNFADTRVDQYDETDPLGGTIETFNNASDLKARKAYLEGLKEYQLVNGNYLLRLSYDLTKSQAKEYEDAFMAIK